VFAQTRGGELETVIGPNVTVGKQWAVFIAIDKYQDRGWNKLDGPVKDAKEIQAILRENYIINEWRELFDEKASAEGIRKLFTELSSQVKEDDSVFVFHAGHGVKDRITEAGSWIPSDAGFNQYRKEGWISHVDIRSYLDRLPAKHVFLISDSCFSGDLLAKPRSGALPQFDTEYYRTAYSFPSRQVMSSGASQEVPDTSDFARRLKSALRRAEGACIDPFKIYEQVREASGTTPRLAALPESTRHEQDGSFLFFRKQINPPPPPSPQPHNPSIAVGSVTVESDVAGQILIDGTPNGTIKAGGTVTITNVTTGITEVAVKESDGTIIKAPVFILRQGQTVTAVIERPLPEGFTFEIIDGKSVIITKYLGNASVVYIPERIQGLPVTVIGKEAFKFCRSINSITIPSSVITIGSSAFSYTSLTGLIIPSSVIRIGDSAFFSCESLTDITISSSVTIIGDYAFYNCSSLESIIVDSRNSAYTSVDGVLFDKNIRTIIKYPEGKKIKTYTIPYSVTTVGNYAFNNCKNLSTITIPSSVITIGDCAFYDSSLSSITIPYSVTTIGDYAFFSESLETIIVDSRNSIYTSVDGVLFDKNIKTIILYPSGKKTGIYSIPSSVTAIGDFAFSSSSLTSVTIPSSVTAIGVSAFSGSSLTSVTIPSSVTAIGDSAFSGSSLTSVTIPFSITTIGHDAFDRCSRLESIIVDNYNTEYTSIDGVLFDKNIKSIIKYPEGKKARTYTIPSSVTTIVDDAFYYCGGLTGITIPSSVTTIGARAFSGCNSLTSVSIPSSVTTIGSYAFNGDSITSVTMSRHTQVGESVFPDTTRIIYRD